MTSLEKYVDDFPVTQLYLCYFFPQGHGLLDRYTDCLREGSLTYLVDDTRVGNANKPLEDMLVVGLVTALHSHLKEIIQYFFKVC